MSRRLPVFVVVVVAPLAGCWLSHELGAPATPDAATPRDGGVDFGRPPPPPFDAGLDFGRPPPPPPDDAAVCPFGWDDTVTATVRLTVDDAFTLYVGGVTVGTHRDWTTPQAYTVTLHRHPGRANVIAVDAENLMSVDRRDRGLVLELDPATGVPGALLTDARWHLGPPTPGWQTETFDDSAWTPAFDEGPNGETPWGPVLGASTARWLWSYDSDLPVGAKVNEEHVTFRRTFYFDEGGVLSDVPHACP